MHFFRKTIIPKSDFCKGILMQPVRKDQGENKKPLLINYVIRLTTLIIQRII